LVDLNTVWSPAGYHLTGVTVVSADVDNRLQNYRLEVKRIGDQDFIAVQYVLDGVGIFDVSADPRGRPEHITHIEGRSLFENVERLRFTFTEPAGYRDIDVSGRPAGATGASFVRGDCNGDGDTDLADALYALFGFMGEVPLVCRDACDFNADGTIDMTNGLYLLTRLFLGGPQIPPPNTCGAPSSALLGCGESGCD
jgi:hypothetical protein